MVRFFRRKDRNFGRYERRKVNRDGNKGGREEEGMRVRRDEGRVNIGGKEMEEGEKKIRI